MTKLHTIKQLVGEKWELSYTQENGRAGLFIGNNLLDIHNHINRLNNQKLDIDLCLYCYEYDLQFASVIEVHRHLNACSKTYIDKLVAATNKKIVEKHVYPPFFETTKLKILKLIRNQRGACDYPINSPEYRRGFNDALGKIEKEVEREISPS